MWLADEIYVYEDLTISAIRPLEFDETAAEYLGVAFSELSLGKPKEGEVSAYPLGWCFRDWPLEHPAWVIGENYRASAGSTILPFMFARPRGTEPFTVSGVEIEVMDDRKKRYRLITAGMEMNFKVSPEPDKPSCEIWPAIFGHGVEESSAAGVTE